MNINRNYKQSFRAHLDENTRASLFLGRKNKEIANETEQARNLLYEIYRDRYVRTIADEHGITSIQIVCGPMPVIGVKPINIFKSNESKQFKDILPQIIKKLHEIKQERSKEQVEFDKNYKIWR